MHAMQRLSRMWLLLAAGFLGLLANSMWTKHQINEILARQLIRDIQVGAMYSATSCMAQVMYAL